MIQITDNAQEQQLLPLFRLGFRPFFFVAALFAVINMVLVIRKNSLTLTTTEYTMARS